MTPARTILVVDDEYSIAESLVEILTWEGYTVVTAANGRDALEAVGRVRPDLILLDYMMPVMDGLQMLRALRQNAEHTALPVVLMTAASLEGPTDTKLWNALIQKPFEIDYLTRVLTRVLAREKP